MPTLGGWEIVIIVAVLLLLFGAKKLPDMARSVGQSARVFKGEMKGLKEDEGSSKPEDTTAEKQELPPSQAQAQAPTVQTPTVQTPAPAAQTPVTPAQTAQPQDRPAGNGTQPGRPDAH